MQSALPAAAQSPAPGEKADALAEAARRGDAALVKKLLDEGVDVNTKYRYGPTWPRLAISNGVIIVRGLKDVFAVGLKR